MKHLIKAVLNVMKDVKNIEKSMTIGSGANAYKGVSDKDVKRQIGESMQTHGLVLLPTGIKPTLRIDRWEEEAFYNGQSQGLKQKQNVFTEVETEYMLYHESGESIKLVGYGHGVDTQDKSAGKATTYAMKNVLLYAFLVPTGHIDDTDNTHSDAIKTPPVKDAKKPEAQKVDPPKVNAPLKKMTKEIFDAMLKAAKDGKKDAVKERMKTYDISTEYLTQLNNAIK